VNLFRDSPLNVTIKHGNPDASKNKYDFTQAPGRHKKGVLKKVSQENKDPTTNNQYEILQNQPENPLASQASPIEKTPQQTGNFF
jgi:hypothetical protein